MVKERLGVPGGWIPGCLRSEPRLATHGQWARLGACKLLLGPAKERKAVRVQRQQHAVLGLQIPSLYYICVGWLIQCGVCILVYIRDNGQLDSHALSAFSCPHLCIPVVTNISPDPGLLSLSIPRCSLPSRPTNTPKAYRARGRFSRQSPVNPVGAPTRRPTRSGFVRMFQSSDNRGEA